MKIAIDMQGAQSESRFRGIGRYVVAFLDSVFADHRGHEYTLVFSGAYPESIKALKKRYSKTGAKLKFRTWFPTGHTEFAYADNTTRTSIAKLSFQAFFDKLDVDIVLITTMLEGMGNLVVTATLTKPTAVISYDLIPYLNPDVYIGRDPLAVKFYEDKLEQLNRTDVALAISHSSGTEIRKVLPEFSGEVVEIGSACDTNVFNEIKDTAFINQTLSKFEIDRDFIFYSGGADARKNLDKIIEAFAKLDLKIRSNVQLVFAGSIPDYEAGVLTNVAKRVGLDDAVFQQIGYVTERELVALYQSCKLHVFASSHEGFGLPTLEAMNCGAVCIAGNNTSLPEVIGLESATFDASQVHDISKAMSKALVDNQWRDDFKNHARLQVKKFSWDKVAKKALDAIESGVANETGKVTVASDQSYVEQIIQRYRNVADFSKSENDYLLELAMNTADNFPQTRARPTIFIDIANMEIFDAGTGIQRVVRQLSDAIIKVAGAKYDVIPTSMYVDGDFARDKRGFFESTSFSHYKDGQYISPKEKRAVEVGPDDLFIVLNLELEFGDVRKMWLDRYSKLGAKIAWVVYDLIPIQYPEYWSEVPHFSQLFEDWIRSVLTYDQAICISETVANELRDFAATLDDPDQVADIDYFHIGANFDAQPPKIDENLKKPSYPFSNGEYYLSVGTLEPRKNHAMVLDAFELLWLNGSDAKYVIVGKEGWNISDLVSRINNHKELGKRLFWLQGIKDSHLVSIYENATALIAASVTEGFGLPLVEAAHHSLPVIAHDIPVFREVAGENAYYFGNSKEQLAEAIINWQALYKEDKHPRSDNINWISWDESARQLLKAVGLNLDVEEKT